MYTYTLEMLVEDPRTFTALNRTNSPVPAPNSCAACGATDRHHATFWITRRDGTGEFHKYEAPDDTLRLARMRARRT